MTQTSPGTVLRPTNGMGTPVPLPLNTPTPGKPKSTAMGTILTTLTSPRVTWTRNTAPLNRPMLLPPPPQSPPRVKGRERPRARIRPHLLKSQRPVRWPPSLRGHHHFLQQRVASLPPISSPSDLPQTRPSSPHPHCHHATYPPTHRTSSLHSPSPSRMPSVSTPPPPRSSPLPHSEGQRRPPPRWWLLPPLLTSPHSDTLSP